MLNVESKSMFDIIPPVLSNVVKKYIDFTLLEFDDTGNIYYVFSVFKPVLAKKNTNEAVLQGV